MRACWGGAEEGGEVARVGKTGAEEVAAVAGRHGDAGGVASGEGAAVEDESEAFEVAVGGGEVDGEEVGDRAVQDGLGVQDADGGAVRPPSRHRTERTGRSSGGSAVDDLYVLSWLDHSL
ncbi:hypothetical protein GCM10009639_35060 [Kitasatospora putterlickiae]|uniref:Uncharacterized protein n=1 Tax=Kitasatospora putterlickiae TaxID=221725 RepID=A0ABN1Y4C9_9ACTN